MVAKARVFVEKTRLPQARFSVPKARFSVPKARFSVPKARFFYALRPDPAAADELAALAAEVAARWGGRPFAAPDIHLTLAFVGMRPLGEQPALEAILRGLPSRFETNDGAGSDVDACDAALPLSRLGSFGHGVLWIGPPSENPRAMPAGAFAHRLANEIRERLRAARIDFDDRPLKLHATLVRGAKAFGGNADGSNAKNGGDLQARAPMPRTIVARSWSPALGASGADSTPVQRYRWSHPSKTRTEPI